MIFVILNLYNTEDRIWELKKKESIDAELLVVITSSKGNVLRCKLTPTFMSSL